MCIRDRSITWDEYIKAVGKIKVYNGLASHYAINSKTEEALNLLKTTEGQYLSKPQCLEDLSPVAVSYTHLDVYKRQALLYLIN